MLWATRKIEIVQRSICVPDFPAVSQVRDTTFKIEVSVSALHPKVEMVPPSSQWRGHIPSPDIELEGTSGSPEDYDDRNGYLPDFLGEGSDFLVKQSISQAEIDLLFDADKRGLVVTLRDLKLVEEFAGSDGRLRFATTQAFLQRFGLTRLSELTATSFLDDHREQFPTSLV